MTLDKLTEIVKALVSNELGKAPEGSAKHDVFRTALDQLNEKPEKTEKAPKIEKKDKE